MIRPPPRSRLSIPVLVISILAVTTTSLLGAGAAVGFSLYRAQEHAQWHALNALLADQASLTLAVPLWNLDDRQIQESMEAILRSEEIHSVEILGPPRDSVHFSATHPTSSATPEPQDTSFRQVRDIHHAGQFLARVRVQMDAREFQRDLETVRLALVLCVLVLAIALAGSLYLVLWRVVLHPIRTLEGIVQRMAETSPDLEQVRELRFHGELESLRSSILELLALLDERFVALRAEARRFRESQGRFRLLIDTIPDLIWLKDEAGTYLACNRMFESFFGAREGDILGKTDFDFVPREQAESFRRNDLAAIAAGGPSSNEEWITFASDGHRALLETTKTPMFDDEGRLLGVLGIGRDITRRHQAEEERRRMDEHLSHVQKLEALGVLVAGVAHNINNVLATILGTASLHENSAATDVDREAFRIMASASRRGREVVRSLVHYSRPQLAQKAPFELHELLAEVKILLDGTSLNRIAIESDPAPGPVWIHGDGSGISHAVLNICLNAIDAMPDGGRIALRTSGSDPTTARLEIEDTGEGIPPEILDRVLEPFFTTKEVGKGTGLGLSMSHGVVKAHGGTLDIESVPGHGTVVRICLPRVPAPLPPAPPPVASGSPEPLRVLVIDDDRDIRDLMRRILERHGHVPILAESGQQGLDALASPPPPDLVVLDQNMPGLTGAQTLARIRSTHPDLPVLIASGQPDIEDMEEFRYPFVGFVAKPCSVAELLEKMAAASASGAPPTT